MKLSKAEIGSPFFKENRVVNPTQLSLGIIYEAIDLLKENLTKKQIVEILTEKNKKSKTKIPDYVNLACQVLDDEYAKDDQSVIGLHLARYNEEFDRLKDYNYDLVNPKYRMKVYLDNHFDMLNTLKAKEKLLQLHTKSMVVRFNQKNTTIVKKKTAFDLSKLPLEEQVELLNLIQKTKVGDEERMGVILRGEEKIQEAEVIEEVVEEVTNIDKIKQRLLKTAYAEKTDTAMLDVRSKLKETFEKKAAEEFKKAGSRTVDK